MARTLEEVYLYICTGCQTVSGRPHPLQRGDTVKALSCQTCNRVTDHEALTLNPRYQDQRFWRVIK